MGRRVINQESWDGSGGGCVYYHILHGARLGESQQTQLMNGTLQIE
jgi:hypothetical protein